MNKLWAVLKVSLLRPWVWLMLVFGLMQSAGIMPFQAALQQGDVRVSIPAFEQPVVVVSDDQTLRDLAKKHQLATIEGLDTKYLVAPMEINDQGEFHPIMPVMEGGKLVYHNGSWPMLDRMPQLQALKMSPPNLLGPDGWKRIGALSQLEILELNQVPAEDQNAMRSFGTDLTSALQRLPSLRQLSLIHTGGIDWTLPPLPNLEYVALSYNLQLENTLEVLSKQSPKLQTLVLSTTRDFVFTEKMQNSLRSMPRLQRLFVVSGAEADNDLSETSRQVEFLRSRLPNVHVYRAAYSLRRLGIMTFMILICGFFPFLAWFQSGLMLSQPLAAVIPGHRGPHLFWPVSMTLISIAVFVGVAAFQNIYWPSALAIASMVTTVTATVLPGHDLTPLWRRWIRILNTGDVIAIFSIMGVGLGMPRTMDGFLLGDFPVVSVLLMVWFLAAAAWKLVRAERLHRILAESGMPGIPGMNLGTQQMFDQPYKPAPGWSMASWQLKRMENAIDRRLAGMDRADWVDMLRRGSPSNPGVWIGFFMMLAFMGGFAFFAPRLLPPNPAGFQPIISVGAMQATMMIIMVNTLMWVSRRSAIAADFLRPISRPKFWKSLRLAILYDLAPAMLFGVGGGLWSIYLSQKSWPPALTLVNSLLVATGYLAMAHGWVTLMVIGKRLWLHATMGVVTMAIVTGLSIAGVVMTIGKDQQPIAALACVFWVLVSGGVMQWAVARKLPDWELG